MKGVRGFKSLVHDAIDLTLDLVQEGHESVARNVMRVMSQVEPIAPAAMQIDEVRRLVTSGYFGSARLLNRLIAQGTDPALALALGALAARSEGKPTAPVPMRSDIMGTKEWAGDALAGALNAAIGDHLHQSDNDLAVPMSLRHRDAYLTLEPGTLPPLGDPPIRLAVFVHGLASTEWCWCMHAATYHGDAATHFGTLLERDLGFAPIFARYNSGRHISENGRQLAEQLEGLMRAHRDPIDEIILLGHSMGGLVVRSACHYGAEEGHSWLERVRHVFSLGSPHHGAPLEKIGNVLGSILAAVDLPGTLIPGRILNGRSAGIKDLRYGNIVDDDWLGHDPDVLLRDARVEVPLLDHISYHFVSATITRDPEHPLGQLIGDLMVRVPSASGPRLETTTRQFPITTQRYGGVMHHELQNHPDVYQQIRDSLAG